MHLLPSLALLAVLAPSAYPQESAGSADNPLPATAERVPGASRHAGIYHVASGTWTRTGPAAHFGPDVVYSNTAWSGYFSSAGTAGSFASGSTNIDEGLIPTPANPSYPQADRDRYSINGMTIGYCDLNVAGSSGWDISFYESYVPCTVPVAPTHSFTVTGLPAAGCWTLTLDLSGGAEFCLTGDGGDGYQGGADDDMFGWGFAYAGSSGVAQAGFYLAGDPASTEAAWTSGTPPVDGTGTYYGPVSPCPAGSGASETTGNHTRDLWLILAPQAQSYNTGCRFFGGYRNVNGCGGPQRRPYASWYMELSADIGACDDLIPTVTYCSSNPTSTGTNATIEMYGSPSASANNVRMVAHLPPAAAGYFLTSLSQGFISLPAGSVGNLCVTQNIGRFVAPGQVKFSGSTGLIQLSTTLGEWSLDSIPESNGTYAASAGVTSNFQLWFRDLFQGMPTSNFSDAIAVTWTP